MVSPASLKSKPAHNTIYVTRCQQRAVIHFALHQLGGGTPMGFYIKDIESQLLKSLEIMNGLPCNPCHREVAHEAEQNKLWLATYVHAVSTTIAGATA